MSFLKAEEYIVLSEFCSQYADLLDLGIDPQNALKLIIQEFPAIADDLSVIHRKLTSGECDYQGAFGAKPEMFDDFFIEVISAAMVIEKLPEAFRFLAKRFLGKHQSEKYNTRRD